MTTAPTPTTDPPQTPPQSAPAPPLGWLAGYRLLGLRLPAQYRPWVARDVASRFFLTWRMGRTFVWAVALFGLFSVAISAVDEPLTRRTNIRLLLVCAAVALLASGKTLVRRTLRWQRVDRRGNAVAPKGLAVLDNAQAVVAGVAVLVVFTAGSALFGFARRPDGFAGARCARADSASLDRIRAGLKDPGTELKETRQLKFGDRRLVSAMVDAEDGPDRIWIWLIEPTAVYELRTPMEEQNSPTSFEPLPPARIDRALGPAVQNLVECLGNARGRR